MGGISFPPRARDSVADRRMVTLVYADADGVERSFTVGPEPVVVGRATECAIRSSDPRVSRNHARFYIDQASTLYIEDLGSSNGVYIGQNKISHSVVPLNEIVLVGSLTFRLVPAAEMAPVEPQQWAQPATQPAAHQYQQPYGAQPGYGGWQQPVPAPVAQPIPHSPVPPIGYAEATQHAQIPDPAASPSSSVVIDSSIHVDPSVHVAGPPATPGIDPELLEAERKARQAAEEERDAYGARMAELHGELRTLREAAANAQAAASASSAGPAMQQRIDELGAERLRMQAELTAAKQRILQLQAQLGTGEPAVVAAEARATSAIEELEAYRDRVTEMSDQVKSAEARLVSAVEELNVARADLLAADDRFMSEMRAQEERAAAELTSRVEELAVCRADLIAAEERGLDMARRISELEQKLGIER
jgi:FHA domain